ncbi:MAG: AIR synthase-related protein, partial [Planctomycetota bacterium]
LSYTEIWISEAQERMVFAVPQESWQQFEDLCQSEGVEACVLGRFAPTQRLTLTYHGHVVGDLSMSFLHDGRPPVIRDAVYEPPKTEPMNVPEMTPDQNRQTVLDILGSLNVASKHWIIRQYDHEVQGGSVIKPLVGVHNDGPSDAAVVRPRPESTRALVLSCGMNPHYGDHDVYHMATSAIDEAVRNAVAVGADPDRIAILDNFCWGYTDRAETLGSLVRAAIACQDLAVELKTPFVSGKDSLNNEFSFVDEAGTKQTISIPPSLLISAMGQIEDASLAVTMDAKAVGNQIWLVGQTFDELGGSHFGIVNDLTGGQVPQVNASQANATFKAVHQVIRNRWLRSCHDLSEGGLAVAAVEMAMAGGLGLSLDLDTAMEPDISDTAALFAESNTRFLIEVEPENSEAMSQIFKNTGVQIAHLGEIVQSESVEIRRDSSVLFDLKIGDAKSRWQAPLDW